MDDQVTSRIKILKNILESNKKNPKRLTRNEEKRISKNVSAKLLERRNESKSKGTSRTVCKV
jgi:hypothetical protein